MSFIKPTILFIFLFNLVANGYLPFCYLGEPSFFPANNASQVFLANVGTILSIGDTITSGFAAGDSSSSSVNEYRGYSFVNGNATDQYTISNIYSAGLYYDIIPGSSSNLINGVRSSGTFYPLYDGFNGASKGMEENFSTQINFVRNQAIGYYGATNLQSKWKLVSVYMGVFKACKICNSLDEPYQTMSIFWKTYYGGVIQNITTQFGTKTIVSMMALPKISQFYSATASTCKTYNQNNNICPCLWTLSTSTLDSIISAANQGMRDAIAAWRIDNLNPNPSQGVVYQPFLTNTVFPSNTLSPVDCFHPNALGHKLMAFGLWNNIREFASTDKSTSVTTSTTLMCDETVLPIYDPDSPY